MCLWRTQWSLYLTASFFVPLAALFLIAKPNIALAFFAGVRSRRQAVIMVVAGFILTAVAMLARPHWVTDWISALMTKEYVSCTDLEPGRIPVAAFAAALASAGGARFRRARRRSANAQLVRPRAAHRDRANDAGGERALACSRAFSSAW